MFACVFHDRFGIEYNFKWNIDFLKNIIKQKNISEALESYT